MMSQYMRRVMTYLMTIGIVAIINFVFQSSTEVFILEIIGATLVLIYLDGGSYNGQR